MQKIPISYQDILSIIKRLLMVAEEYNEPFGEPIVMVGGTAMTAHRIRKQSFNVDLYARIFSDDIIHQVEQEFREQFGSMFKIDVTSTENIWGMIMLRDIHKSEPDTMIQVGDNQYTIQKLSYEDLFLLKLDSNRKKDQDDLPILYEKTNLDLLIKRFNIIVKWHGDRDSVLGYADSFVATMKKFGNHDPVDVISSLNLSKYMIALLYESWSNSYDE
jgi:hypothetical protein